MNAVVVLEYRSDEVRLTVRDDGVGMAQRSIFGRTPNTGVGGAHSRLRAVGGALNVHAQRPRGMVVEATVPVGRAKRAKRWP